MKFIDINNGIKAFLKGNILDYSIGEIVFFSGVVLIILSLSLYANDNKIAVVSAICGISYTVLNGKSKISCYFFGIIGTLCYSYLAFKNGLWGNFGLNFFYYLPLEIIGLINWKKHLINKFTVRRTQLNNSQKRFLIGLLLVITVILVNLAYFYHFSVINFLDFLTLILSIIAMILAVKRCIEQWHLWSAVNFLSIILWTLAYINGSNCLATIIMWGVYFVLGIYFLKQWQNNK